MKKKLIVLAAGSALTMTFASIATAATLETCSLGNACTYRVAGHSKRIIDTSGLQAGKTYICQVNSLSADKFKLDNFVPSNGVSVYGPAAEGNYFNPANPFFIKGPQAGSGTLKYNLRNTDTWGNEHNISYTCRDVNNS